MTQKIIFDTDPGIDDALAIAYAVKSPDLELIGITTIFGNVLTPLATDNALRILEIYKAAHVPVANGCELPLQQPLRPPSAFVHGEDGLGNINLPPAKIKAVNESAVEMLLRLSRVHGKDVIIVAVGPLTNIASAIRADSGFARRIGGLVVMGGAAAGGNLSPVAEANVHADPHAADIVFQAPWHAMAMVGLDVTQQVIMTNAHFAALRDSAGELGQFIWNCSRFYTDFYKQFRAIDGCNVHDAAALLYVTHPQLFTTQQARVRVTAGGIGAGNTICDFGSFQHPDQQWHATPQVDVCMGVDAAAVVAAYLQPFGLHNEYSRSNTKPR